MKNKKLEDFAVKLFLDIYMVSIVIILLGTVGVSFMGSAAEARAAQIILCYSLFVGPMMAFGVYELTRFLDTKLNRNKTRRG